MNERDTQHLLTLCGRWDLPRGPVDAVDAEKEMRAEAARLGPDAARELVALVLEQARAGFAHLDVLETFMSRYTRAHPEAACAALLAALTRTGPAQIVEHLALCKAPGVSQRIIDAVTAEPKDDRLVFALITTLRSLGDPPARAYLATMPRDRQSPANARELEATLNWLAAQPPA